MLLSVCRGVNRSYIDDLLPAGIAKSLVDQSQNPRTANTIPSTVVDFISQVSAFWGLRSEPRPLTHELYF